MTGWAPADILGRALTPPRHVVLSLAGAEPLTPLTEEQMRQRPLVRQRSQAELRERLELQRRRQLRKSSAQVEVAGEEEDQVGKESECRPFISSPLVPQYPATLKLIKAFVAGEVMSIRSPWRSVWADGFCYEKEYSVWVTKMEEVVEKDGRRWYRPMTAIVSCGRDDVILVDPL